MVGGECALASSIRIRSNRQQTPEARGLAAESLGKLGKRRAIRALGHFARSGPRRKTPRTVLRALEARLEAGALPDTSGVYWSVKWEAVAMLRGTRSKCATDDRFRTAILAVLRDPLNHGELWQWAMFYRDESLTGDDREIRGLFDAAVQTIHDAGFDPVRFGQGAAERS